jgi:protein-L-isoaspartate(D-aspartate) O-methyltransferase
MLLARLLQAAHVRKDDIALDIGCGTGYATALLGCVCNRVTGIEPDQKMTATATELLKQLGVPNASILRQEDLRKGYAPKAPYNVILINGAVGAVPDGIQSQLADGGRLVTVLSRNGHMGTATLITRHGSNFVTQSLFEAATPFLAGFEKQKTFVF